jgi:hypothetical protein
MNSTIFVGCSFTKGEGLVDEKTSPDLWVNQLHQSVGLLKETTLINLAEGGNSNETIFHDAVRSSASSPKYLFVVWTIFPRFWINPGVELYNTTQLWGPATNLSDISLHQINYSKKYLTDIKNRFFDLIHDHYEIVKILAYSQTVVKLSKLSNTKVFFINGLLPWDTDYFNKQDQTVPSNTTQYTQSLLDADTRNDQEYWALYDKVHNAYTAAGLPDNHWLNLYHGYKKHFMLDFGTDNQHPGPLSNQAFADFLIKKLSFSNI